MIYSSKVKNIILCLAATLLFIMHSTELFSQVDTEFWFVVPELSNRGNTGGTPGSLRIATMELAATVTISMPANPYHPTLNPGGFQDIVVDIAANSTAQVNLTSLIDVAANPTNNRLENKPLTPDGINPFGLHITATNMITAYWEVNYAYGSDLWTLKGRNALGNQFYTPFQTQYNNRNLVPRTYSSIDICATTDNTQVTITLPPGKGASFGSLVTGIAPGGTYTLTLNSGQTFSLFPLNYSIAATDRLAGTMIESTEPICVTLKDDALAVGSQGQDVIGDQIVPVNIVGSNYIVPDMGNPNHVYVLATQDNTNIYVYGADGLPIGPSPYTTLNRGQQALVIVPGGSKFARLTSTLNPSDPPKPFYTFQLGVENQARGGALVPAIGCTGNTQLAFTRARDENKFQFFIIVKRGNEDKFLLDGIRQDGIIDPGAFTEIVGSGGYMAWFSNSININTLPIGQHLVENTGDIFHLGIFNGFPGAGQGGLYYGYYSDFGGLNIGANVAGTNSSVVRACYGDRVQLYAYGGTIYKWTPDSYLDNATINLPTAINLPPGPHNYTVEVSGACNSGTIDLTVLVSTPVKAFFETSVLSGCSPLKVRFDDKSSGGFFWQYDIGDTLITYDLDAATPFLPPPSYPQPFSISHTYTNYTNLPLTDTITLLVKNESGCSDIYRKTIVVYPEIYSAFSVAGADIGCDPFPVQFQNNSTGNTASWEWEFGDGGSSVEMNPLHVFRNQFGPESISFQTRLIAISPYYCRDTSTHTVTVLPYVEANFVYDTVFACTPHEILITDQSFGASVYEWDFGDGTTSTSAGPHLLRTFYNNTAAPVNYTIRLRVRNKEGCTDELQRIVTVLPQVQASFIPSLTEGCSPFEARFQNISTGAATYYWSFGDGGTSADISPAHLYDKNLSDHDTTFSVILIATSAEFCRDTIKSDIVVHPYIEAIFAVKDIKGCTPFSVEIENQSVRVDNYLWDFGDGSPVSTTAASTFNHTYNNSGNAAAIFPLKLIVRNNEGCTDTLVKDITVHPPLTSNFMASTFEGCHPLDVTFSDLSLNAGNYLWDFGDGASSVISSPVHAFANYGISDTIYLVTLTTATIDGECTRSVSWPVTVHPMVHTNFTIPQKVSCSPFDVTIMNASVNGALFRWSFGDGTDTVTTSLLPLHHKFANPDYAAPKEFEIILVAESAEGCSGEARKTVAVEANVTAGFDLSIVEGCHPLTVNLFNNSRGASYYEWDFGDGFSGSSLSPVHTFTNYTDNVVTRQIRLVTTSQANCTSEAVREIAIHPKPRAAFEVDKVMDCPPVDAVVTNTSMNADRYLWAFGDGDTFNTDALLPFNHIFNNNSENPVTYNIKLTSLSDFGCVDSSSQNLIVFPGTFVDFSFDEAGCSPLTSRFVNESTGGDLYTWDFGDGSSSFVKDPSHIYFNNTPDDHRFFVTLRSVTQFGCSGSKTDTVLVYPQPRAEFIVTPTHQMFPSATVGITNMTNAGSWEYSWDMDDGNASVLRDPLSHSYTAWGEYNIRLNVSSEHCRDSVAHMVRILAAIPVAVFDTVSPGCEPHPVQFRNRSQYGTSYLWEFDDGTTSTDFEPMHVYQNDGIYNVKLTVKGEGGAGYVYHKIEVYGKPLVKFSVTPELVMLPDQEIHLSNFTENGTTFLWNFGDGQTSAEFKPSHLYSSTGTYDISLEAWTEHGCNDKLVKPGAVEVVGKGLIVFPNAFEPSMTGPTGGYFSLGEPEYNYVFHPVWDGVTLYKLEIFTRWGNLIYTSEDVNKGWDGYFQGKLSQQGVYVWKCTGTFSNGRLFNLVGDVTLLLHER
ncbi:MAG: PKD domain-containing protein [Chloroflexota bacterium]